MVDLSALRKVFRLSAISLIYLVLSNDPQMVSASGGTEYTPVFKEMTTYAAAASDTHVHHIEVDARNSSKLIFSDYTKLAVTDGVTTETLVGSTFGYAEGKGTAAMFRHISGFVQMGDDIVIVSDNSNYCLRIVPRDTLETSQFVGECLSSGFKDGLDAQFKGPSQIIKDARCSTRLLVADGGNGAVRQVDAVSRMVTTLIQSGLTQPTGLAFSTSGNSIFISDYHSISEYNLLTQSLSKVSGSTSSGDVDGKVNEARFYRPRELMALSEDVILVADRYNHKLKVIDRAKDSVTSICTGTKGTVDGPPDSCQIDHAVSLLKRDGKIYLGQHNAIRVLTFAECTCT